ncbi:MarR family winged helix-turn-helix transcriptional regulator [Streptomyces sp.]|uniref:MarR family winged helix-turn-helix transcriptional regulator n=1 Tax=Streptomyces sp. TaxID=1931 RepID=UPI002F4130BD
MEPRTAAGTTSVARATATALSPEEITGRLADQLVRLSRRLHRSQRRLLEPLGITPAQARLLRTLAHCDQPPRMADLAQRLDVVPRAVTTLVDALEARELVRRVPDPHNRRVIRIELLEGGGQALLDLRRARRTAAAELLGPLDDGQRAALTALLDVLDEGEPRADGTGQAGGHECAAMP